MDDWDEITSSDVPSTHEDEQTYLRAALMDELLRKTSNPPPTLRRNSSFDTQEANVVAVKFGVSVVGLIALSVTALFFSVSRN